MILPRILRHRLWKLKMRKLLKSAKTPAIDHSFSPKRCIILYPAYLNAWEQLVHLQTQLWPGTTCDFAYIGYQADNTSPETIAAPYHCFDDKMLGAAYNLSPEWLSQWSKATDLLVVINPDQKEALDLLAVQLPAFFKVSVFETEFGELYSFVLASGPENPGLRLQTLQTYLQKIMQL